jgi:hypothetical protein
MDGNTMRTLREYIHELRCRDRDNYGTVKQPGFDTTLNQDVDSEQGNGSGDAGRGKDSQG